MTIEYNAIIMQAKFITAIFVVFFLKAAKNRAQILSESQS